jgi:glycosyltransferase involved in cell wall biosynthesis
MPHKEVLYDHQIFTMQTHGGISRYFTELLAGLADDPEYHTTVGIAYSKCEYLLPRLNRFQRFLAGLSFRKEKHLRKSLNAFSSKHHIKKYCFDVFHPTYYSPYFLELLKGKPFVVTVFDMAHERFPALFPPGDKTKTWKQILTHHAARIIAISESTKNDLMQFLGIPESKISVVRLGCNSSHISTVPPSIDCNGAFILFVGHRNAYKNFDLLARGIAGLLQKENLQLLCCGSGRFSPEEEHLLDDLKIRDRVIHIPALRDEHLAFLYSKAALFVFPSRCEGFGIPILEAFSNGCPCALSDIPVFREVAGPAASYFDPMSGESISAVIRHLLTSSDLRRNLAAAGRERVRNFSWKTTIAATKAVYRLVCG